MWPLLAAGAGIGLLKGAQDRQSADRDRVIQAAKARYSPWTGMKPEDVKDPNVMGSILQGGLTGAALGQGIDAANADQAYREAATNNLKSMSQQSPWASMPQQMPTMPPQRYGLGVGY